MKGRTFDYRKLDMARQIRTPLPRGFPTVLRRRNEPEEFFNPTKRPNDPTERTPKRPQPSLPQFKCLTD